MCTRTAVHTRILVCSWQPSLDELSPRCQARRAIGSSACKTFGPQICFESRREVDGCDSSCTQKFTHPSYRSSHRLVFCFPSLFVLSFPLDCTLAVQPLAPLSLHHTLSYKVKILRWQRMQNGAGTKKVQNPWSAVEYSTFLPGPNPILVIQLEMCLDRLLVGIVFVWGFFRYQTQVFSFHFEFCATFYLLGINQDAVFSKLLTLNLQIAQVYTTSCNS